MNLLRLPETIQEFTIDHLSNWYVRLSRRRFWKGDYSKDKISAYQTLYTCLINIAKLSAPIAPFFMDKLYGDLNQVSKKEKHESVHLADFGMSDKSLINRDLEQKMEVAQRLSSMVLALRKKESIKVRQPLRKIMVPITNATFKRQLEEVKQLILSEVNVKELEFLEDSSGVLVKHIKPNFKKLGPKFGKDMKAVAAKINAFSQENISELENKGEIQLQLKESMISISINDVEISSKDIPGWLVTSDGKYTVALDITIDNTLIEEGIAREFVNRIQNIRKEKGFDLTDQINISIEFNPKIEKAIINNKDYICSETLAQGLDIVKDLDQKSHTIEIDQDSATFVSVELVKN